MSVFLLGPVLGGLAKERVQPSEMAKSPWEPPSEKLPFLFTSIWCAVDGKKKKKVVEEESLWLSCCWALWSGPSTVPGALRA